jgi:hypothetical protein
LREGASKAINYLQGLPANPPRPNPRLAEAVSKMPDHLTKNIMELYLGYSAGGKMKKKPLNIAEIALQLGISRDEVEDRLRSGTEWLKANVRREGPMEPAP